MVGIGEARFGGADCPMRECGWCGYWVAPHLISPVFFGGAAICLRCADILLEVESVIMGHEEFYESLYRDYGGEG